MNIYFKTHLFVDITSQISFDTTDWFIMTEYRQLVQKTIKKIAWIYNTKLLVAVFLMIMTLMQISSEINCDVMKLIEQVQDRVQ
jgi:hypothetical protein